jgi:hypothetical protein
MVSVSDFLEFVSKIKQEPSSKITQLLISHNSQYIPYLEYYMDKNNAPKYKDIITNESSEEYKDIDIEFMINLS